METSQMFLSRAAMDALRELCDLRKGVAVHMESVLAILDRCTVVESGTIKNSVLVDRGALCMALNVLRRADKTEIADALESACSTPPAAESAEAQCPFCHSPKHGLVLEPCPALNDPKTFDLVPALREVTEQDVKDFRYFFDASYGITFGSNLEALSDEALRLALEAFRHSLSTKQE